MPKLNLCAFNESNQNLQDSISEHCGTGIASQVATSEGQVRNEKSSEFGQSLEGDLIELMKYYRCVWDASCRAFKENQKKQHTWKEIAMKLNKMVSLILLLFHAPLYLHRNFSQSTSMLLSKSTQRNPCWF